MNVPFRSWQAEGDKAGTGVLVLVPGYNGKGEQMLDARWKAFAGKNGLVLLAPTFHAEGKENNEGRGYYYRLGGRSAEAFGQDASVGNRIELWGSALQMAAENPRGFGTGTGEQYMQWYQPLDRQQGYRTMVNSYLTFLVAGVFSTTMEEWRLWVIPAACTIVLVTFAVGKRKRMEKIHLLVTGGSALAGCAALFTVGFLKSGKAA